MKGVTNRKMMDFSKLKIWYVGIADILHVWTALASANYAYILI